MNAKFSFWLSVFCLSAVVGCGGGGGGDSTPTTPTTPTTVAFLQIEPSFLKADIFVGERQYQEVKVFTQREIKEGVNVQIASDHALIKSISYSRRSSREFNVLIGYSDDVSPGVYRGEFGIRLCKDDPAVCADPYVDEVVSLPYVIKVSAAEDKRVLSNIVSDNLWQGQRGDAGRAGYYEANIDLNKFSKRWVFDFPADEVPDGEARSADGRVYVLSKVRAPYGTLLYSVLRSIRESDGAVEWVHRFDGYVTSVNFVGDKIYLPSDSGSRRKVWKLDRQTGMAEYDEISINMSVSSGAINSVLPLEAGGYLYAYSGAWGSQTRFSSVEFYADGRAMWNVMGYGVGYDSPLRKRSFFVANNTAYASARVREGVGEVFGLLGVDIHTGMKKFFTPNVFAGESLKIGMGVACGCTGSGDALGSIFCVDSNSGEVRWKYLENVASFAVSPKFIISTDGVDVTWRGLVAGEVQGSWRNFGVNKVYDSSADIIAVGDVVFVSSIKGVYALKMGVPDPVWAYRVASGRLELSRTGILYVGQGRRLVAFNLH